MFKQSSFLNVCYRSGFRRSVSALAIRQQPSKDLSCLRVRRLKLIEQHKPGLLLVDVQRQFTTMAPIPEDLLQSIEKEIASERVVIFSKSTCPFCTKVKALFDSLNIAYKAIELDGLDNGGNIQQALSVKTGKATVPQVFINGNFVGGCDDTFAKYESGHLAGLLKTHSFDYDLIVIGGGSGGLAASKKAAQLGKKVAVLDYVEPTPLGTKWGLGGTCVNVGCIPKKLMHQSALIGQSLKDAFNYGWETSNGEEFELNKTIKHNWTRMRDEIQNYIKSLNFGYRAQLREEKVTYINAYASFLDKNSVKTVDKSNKESIVTADKFIIATGERPRYPTDCVGAVEYGVTSDDLFSLTYCPGKTLVIGASYVALECAGFLKGIGLDVTVMVRSILLRGFDQQMAEKIGDYMKEEGINFIRPCVPTKIERLKEGEPGLYKVTGKMSGTGEEVVGEYNTILFAIGRDPCTDKIGLNNTGVVRKKSGKIQAVNEQTDETNIYAIGDVLDGKPELTPVAIEAGTLLAKRMFANSSVLCDYINVPTTVFTPLEYGAAGYSEEDAIKQFGEDNIEVYVQNFTPLEWTVPHRPSNACFAKLICLRKKENQQETALGFHYLGPNAGEVTQLAGLALKKKCTKDDFDALIGIHPTCAEIFTTLTVTKRSGKSAQQKGC